MTKVTIDRALIEQAIDVINSECGYGGSNSYEPRAIAEALRAALAEPAVETADFDQIATERYKVVEAHESLFHRWAVVAWNGKQQLYVGREVECQNMARKFAGAFLDGAWLASQHTAPPSTGEIMKQILVSEELLRQVIEKAEATTRHFNIERLGESTYKDTNTRCELHEAVNKLRVALEQPAVEPVWVPIEQKYPQDKEIDILMADGSILCGVLPQSDGDLWWEGAGTGERFIDPKYANVTHWRVHCEVTPPQAQQPAVVPLTTEEYTDLAHRIASKYAHSSYPRHIAYTFLPHTLEQFTRAIEQLVRRKAGL